MGLSVIAIKVMLVLWIQVVLNGFTPFCMYEAVFVSSYTGLHTVLSTGDAMLNKPDMVHATHAFSKLLKCTTF